MIRDIGGVETPPIRGGEIHLSPCIGGAVGGAVGALPPPKAPLRTVGGGLAVGARLREADSAEANGLTLIMYFFYLTLVMDSTLLSNEFSIGRKRIQHFGRTNSTIFYKNVETIQYKC